jgi:hypothetical protein
MAVVDRQALTLGMDLGDGDILGCGVDRNHVRSEARERFGQQARAAAYVSRTATSEWSQA